MLGVLEQVFSRGESMGFSFEKKKKPENHLTKLTMEKRVEHPKVLNYSFLALLEILIHSLDRYVFLE